MRITRIDARLLRMPPPRPVTLPVAGSAAVPPSGISVLLVQIETDAGLIGLGFGTYADGGRSFLTCIEDDLTPLLTGEDPLHHERLWAKSRSLENPAAHAAYAGIDIALWDLKAKAAGVPLGRLLGGVRDSAKAFTAETAGAGLTADDVIAVARSAKSRGLTGVRVAVAGIDPEKESQKLVTIRDTLGEDIWFAVTVEGRFDYETALPFGRFIEEEIGADWYEDPLPNGDPAGYAQLSGRIDTPLATGGRFTSIDQFVRLMENGVRAILRPSVLRLGGVTPWLKVAALSEAYHRPVVPWMLPEVGVHLACGLPGVQAAEYVPWLAPLFVESVKIVDGNLQLSSKPGLGLELNAEALERFRA